jgi:phenylpyruvate tautomerase PptA (4-oxalocrotonate tautomerase family)
MPILDVEIVLRPGEFLDPGLAQELADHVDLVFGTPPGRTWVKLRALAPEHYAESGGGLPQGVYPIFVSVLKGSLSPPDRLALEIAELTRAAAAVCHRPPENVHILYDPEAAGRVSFGGRLLSGSLGP